MQTTFEYPVRDAAVVTPNDGADLPRTARAIYIGGAGALRITPINGAADITIAAVPAGTMLPIAVRRVWATGTTATSIVALI